MTATSELNIKTLQLLTAAFELDFDREVKAIKRGGGTHITAGFYGQITKHIKDNLGVDILFESANDSASTKLFELDDEVTDLNTINVIIRPVGKQSFTSREVELLSRTIMDKITDFHLYRQGGSSVFISGGRSKVSKPLNPREIRSRSDSANTISRIGLIYPIYKFEMLFK